MDYRRLAVPVGPVNNTSSESVHETSHTTDVTLSLRHVPLFHHDDNTPRPTERTETQTDLQRNSHTQHRTDGDSNGPSTNSIPVLKNDDRSPNTNNTANPMETRRNQTTAQTISNQWISKVRSTGVEAWESSDVRQRSIDAETRRRIRWTPTLGKRRLSTQD